jgi:hypothetical protein
MPREDNHGKHAAEEVLEEMLVGQRIRHIS